MGPHPLAGVERFAVVQRVALGAGRYEIRGLAPDGGPSPVLAYARTTRFSLREEVRFWADAEHRTPLARYRARRRLALRPVYDVTDPAGHRLASFRKDAARSLVRSTWHLTWDGATAVGTERDPSVALLRRGWGMLPSLGVLPSPLLFHFDFTDTRTGVVVMTSDRERALRDRYVVTVPGAALDGRVAAAMAVALDALQGR